MAKYTQQTFIDKCVEKHNNRYCYKDVQFQSSKNKIIINCNIHGPFEQVASSHLRGDGCKLCNRSGGKGVYSNNYFIKWPEEKQKNSILYIIKMQYENDVWYKVGITISTVSERYSKQIYKQMQIDTVKQIQLPLFDAFTAEQQILKDLKQYKFKHDLKFCGHTECFYDNDQVAQYLESI